MVEAGGDVAAAVPAGVHRLIIEHDLYGTAR
jgi:hypothetical protein